MSTSGVNTSLNYHNTSYPKFDDNLKFLVFSMTSKFAKVFILLGRLSIVEADYKEATEYFHLRIVCSGMLRETKDVLGAMFWTKNNKDVLNSLISCKNWFQGLNQLGK